MIAGEIIKLCRKKRGYTMRMLGKKAGLTAQMISNYEHGKCEPRLDTFLSVINSMDFDMEIVDLQEAEED